MTARSTAFLLTIAALSLAAAPAAAQRERFSMDPGWRFTLGDPSNAQQPRFDDHGWRRVDLPHDWSIEGVPTKNAPAGGRGGYFPTGIGWYRKAFRLPAGWRGHEVWLQFDGVYMNSDVWINGYHLGHRPYGYVSFYYDLTKHLVPGINVVAVRVDNSEQPNSRWYTGSGIYRHVWLTVVDPLHVGHWGVYVTTPHVDSARADVVVRTRVDNDQATARRVVLRSIVVDSGGHEVARGDTTFTLAPGAGTDLEQRIAVPSPMLWSTETPTMYALRSEVVRGNRTVDDVTTPFGIRTIRWDKDRGFLLNGKHVKLRGVNLHHAAGAVGAAVPERIWQARLETLKAMGANAIRTSHNPRSPEFLDLCDRMGFLVMAEAFDEWTIGKVPYGYHLYFADWSRRDLTDFIHRDRNHPSIVIWSAGNEIGEQSTPNGVDVLRRLVGIFHSEDPTRPVTTGNDQIDADGHPATLAFLNAEDVVGYNYVDRWHERRELFAEQDRHAHPDWKMVGTESSGARNAFGGRYSLSGGARSPFGRPAPLGGDSTAIQPNYTTGMIRAERLWKWESTHDYFAGDFMWTGIDYLGETFWPRKGAGAGAIDITGRPKDSYYLYQSLWTTKPMLHLFPHWNWPGRKGQVIPVIAYTNCNSVELFLNGKSLGVKRLEFPAQGTSGGWNSYAKRPVFVTTDDLHLEWDVPYAPGVLTAVGRTRDGAVACHAEVRTAGPSAALRLVPTRDTITDAPGDVGLVRFQVVDSAATVVPTADNVVHVAVRGGTLVALDNADLADLERYQDPHRHVFNGRGLAIVRAARPGVLEVTATADGLTGTHATLVVRPGIGPKVIPAAR